MAFPGSPGPFGRRRRPYGGYGDPWQQQPPPGWGPPPPGYGYPPPYGYRRGGPAGGSCLRDLFLLDAGCCAAELLGCGPQLALVLPSVVGRRRHATSLRSAADGPATSGRSQRWLLGLIGTYQREVSPRRAPCCRYSPSCSHYAAEAVARHGTWRGLRLTARRLLRCRPGSSGGVDPVPIAA